MRGTALIHDEVAVTGRSWVRIPAGQINSRFSSEPSRNPVPGLDRDTYLSPVSVYGEKKFGFWYGVLSYIGSYCARIS